MSNSDRITVVTKVSDMLLDKETECAEVKEMEELLADRFGETDIEFQKFKDTVFSPPPCLDHWGLSRRHGNRGNNRYHHRGNDSNREHYRNQGDRNHFGGGDFRGNYDDRSYGDQWQGAQRHGDYRHPRDRYHPYPRR